MLYVISGASRSGKTMIAHSGKIRRSCGIHDFAYFDTGRDFEKAIEGVKAYLLQNQ